MAKIKMAHYRDNNGFDELFEFSILMDTFTFRKSCIIKILQIDARAYESAYSQISA